MLWWPKTCTMKHRKRFVQRESYAEEGIANGVSYTVQTIFVFEIVCDILVVKCSCKFTDFVRNAKSKIFVPYTSSPIKCFAHSSLRRPTHFCTMPPCQFTLGCIDLAPSDAEEEHSSQHNGVEGKHYRPHGAFLGGGARSRAGGARCRGGCWPGWRRTWRSR
jgi:hypothetical protein